MSLFWRPLIKIEGVGLHPGIPLLLLVQGVGRLLYWKALLFGEKADFYTYIAQHFHLFVAYVTCAMAAVHVVAAYAVYRVALRLTDRFIIGVAAVFAYTTSICVLARIVHYNPERFTTIFNLFAILWIVNYVEAASDRRYKTALLWAVLSAASATGAFVSKFYCAGHMLILLPILILAWRRGKEDSTPITFRFRLSSIACVMVSFAFCMWLVSLKMSWTEFFTYWFNYAPGSENNEAIASTGSNFFSGLMTLFVSGVKAFIQKSAIWAPNHPGNWFTKAEWIFLLVGLLGFVAHLFVRPDRRRLGVALILAVAFGYPTATFAGGYPYVQFMIGIFSAFAAVFAVFIQDKLLGARLPDFVKLVVAFGILFVAHYGAITGSLNVFKEQRGKYEKVWRAYYEALDYAGPNGRVGLLKAHRPTDVVGAVDWWAYAGSPFSKALLDRFVSLRGQEKEEDLFGAHVRAVVELDASGKASWRRVDPDFTQGDEMVARAASASGVNLPHPVWESIQEGNRAEVLRGLSSAAKASGDSVRYFKRLLYMIRPELKQKLWLGSGTSTLNVMSFSAQDVSPWRAFANDQKRPIIKSGVDASTTREGSACAYIEVGDSQGAGNACMGVTTDIPAGMGRFGVIFWMRAEHPDSAAPFLGILFPTTNRVFFNDCVKVVDGKDGWAMYCWEGSSVDLGLMRKIDPSDACVKVIGVNFTGPANKVWIGPISIYIP
jgi:hypothetical protein